MCDEMFMLKDEVGIEMRMADEDDVRGLRPEGGDPTVYTVEKILKKRKRQGFTEYLVKWKNYTSK